MSGVSGRIVINDASIDIGLFPIAVRECDFNESVRPSSSRGAVLEEDPFRLIR